ncbi:MAG: helix-turn-helix domain-containing protein [Saprospiraceae bacterium]
MKSKNSIKEYHLHKENPFQRQFEIYDLSEYWSKNKNHSTKPHSHSFYQIIWFFNDSGTHYVDFESYEIKQNTIFFISKNQVHSFENRDDYEGILIHFNEIFIYQAEEDIDIFLRYNVFNSINFPFIRVTQNIEIELKNFINIIQLELNNGSNFGHESILSNILKSFLIRVEREKRNLAHETKSQGNILFVQFRKLLEHQYKNNKTVNEYAEKLHVSPKTLNKIVKNSTGKTTSQIIQDRIIIEAKRQLIYSNRFINEIGFELGFDDPSYFVKFFKKIVKTTPSQFREAYS